MIPILLTHSFFLAFDPKQRKRMQPYPPIGTLYAASVLRNAGFGVQLFDPMFASTEAQIENYLRNSRPKYVIFFEDNFNYLSKMCLARMREACFAMIALAKKYGCLCIAQGSDATDNLTQYFNHGIDFIIRGEGERTVVELLASVEQRALPLDNVRGLVYRVDGAITETGRRELIHDLDTIPFPAWDLIDINQYRNAWIRHHQFFSLNITTTRGCPFHCNWCAKPIYGQVYQVRSPKNVVDELTFLRKNFQTDHVWFADDIFGLKPGWIQEYAALVKEGNVITPFSCQSRVDLLLEGDTIKSFAEAGCHTVWVGAESGSQKILDAMEKGTTVDQIYAAKSLLKEQKIRTAFFLQFGYPGESTDDISKTLKMVRDCAPDDIGISVSYPLPGTKFYKAVKRSLQTKQHWTTSEDIDLMFPGSYSPRFYRALHRFVHKEFRIRQALAHLRRWEFHHAARRKIAALGWNLFGLCIAFFMMQFARLTFRQRASISIAAREES